MPQADHKQRKGYGALIEPIAVMNMHGDFPHIPLPIPTTRAVIALDDILCRSRLDTYCSHGDFFCFGNLIWELIYVNPHRERVDYRLNSRVGFGSWLSMSSV
jgi:hypothetical protein